MIAVVQRVLRAQVTVEGRLVGRIGRGMLVLAAVEVADTETDVEWMAGKLAGLRIFRNGEKHFDWDIQQMAQPVVPTPPSAGAGIAGETDERVDTAAKATAHATADEGVGTTGFAPPGILLVSNFTVAAETAKGRRPSLNNAAPPERGRVVFEQLVVAVRRQVPAQVAVETGEFGAMMEVELNNDGPVTFIVKSGADRS